MALTIGEAARHSGCSAPTLRFYESIGLLAAPARTGGGRRTYDGKDVARLVFIRRARSFGLSVPQVRTLAEAAAVPVASCAMARPVVEAHLQELQARRAELEALELALTAILARCDEGCSTGEAAACAIFDDFHLPEPAPRTRAKTQARTVA